MSKLQALTQLYKHFNFVVAGSMALKLHGKLQREPNDIDILVDNNRVFKQIQQFTWNEGWLCTREDDTADTRHWQFWFAGERFCMFDVSEYKRDDLIIEKQRLEYDRIHIDSCVEPLRVLTLDQCLLAKLESTVTHNSESVGGCGCKSCLDLVSLITNRT
jgi:hypothetical protein